MGDFPGAVFIGPIRAPGGALQVVGGEVEISFEEFKKFAQAHPDRWEPRALRADRKMEKPILTRHRLRVRRWVDLAAAFLSRSSWSTATPQAVAGYNASSRSISSSPAITSSAPRYRRTMDPVPIELASPSSTLRQTLHRLHREHALWRFPRLATRSRAPLRHEAHRGALHQRLHDHPRRADEHLLFPTIWDPAIDNTRLEMAASHDCRIWNWYR